MLRSPPRWISAGSMTFVVVVLLAMVAASTAFLPGSGASPAGETVSGRVPTLGGVLRVVYLAILVSALYRWLVSREEARARGGQRRRTSPAVTLIVLLVIGGALIWGASFRDFSDSNQVLPPLSEEDQERAEVMQNTDETLPPLPEFMGEEGASSSPVETLLSHPWLAATTVLLVAVALVIALFRRPQPEPDSAPAVATAAPSPPVRSQEVAEPSRDPRARVLAAYTEVERVAAAHGLARPRAETVSSHLRRLGGGDATTLSVLYNQARFSHRVVDGAAASRAESAGHAIRQGMS